jgi:peptide/nickel transport system ATP-binding protein
MIADPAEKVPVLDVEGLCVNFRGAAGEVQAVRDVSLRLGVERLGVVGESGSGKSTLGRAIIGLLPPAARVQATRLDLDGASLLRMSPAARARLRGSRISMILQDPRHALHPTMTVGAQVAEACRLHRGLTREAAARSALERLAEMRIDDPARVARLYPHEVSGGMGQRVMIAMMLVGQPRLVIADEPTSALDVTVRQGVLDLLQSQVRERGIALLLISHDINMVRKSCDRVLVMYRGRIVEHLGKGELSTPRHPYTCGLVASLPRLTRLRSRLPALAREASWDA